MVHRTGAYCPLPSISYCTNTESILSKRRYWVLVRLIHLFQHDTGLGIKTSIKNHVCSCRYLWLRYGKVYIVRWDLHIYMLNSCTKCSYLFSFSFLCFFRIRDCTLVHLEACHAILTQWDVLHFLTCSRIFWMRGFGNIPGENYFDNMTLLNKYLTACAHPWSSQNLTTWACSGAKMFTLILWVLMGAGSLSKGNQWYTWIL